MRLLKQVIQRLCGKLKDYQKQFGSNKSLLAAEQAQVDQILNKPLQDAVPLQAPDPDDIDPANAPDDGFAQLLGGHTIGPLV